MSGRAFPQEQDKWARDMTEHPRSGGQGLYLGEAPAFAALYLLPFVWLLFESRKREPEKGS